MAKPVFYGGQAVIEGVMMRGPGHVAVAVRRESGEIETVVRQARPWLTVHPAFNKIFLRGGFALVDSLRVGVWGLRWSASRAMLDAPTPDGVENPPKAPEGDVAIKGTMGIGLLIGVFLFIVLPTILTGAIRHSLNGWTLNFIETVIRLGFFFGYIAAIGAIPGVRRVFQYHGAEHRTINAWEMHAPLDPETCRGYSIIHPRCGTSFMMFVLILASVVYAFLGWHTPLVRLAIRLGILPIVAGVAYELLRLAGTFRSSAVIGALTWPGRFTQRFTTCEPDDAQTEVAITALKAVVAAEGAEVLA